MKYSATLFSLLPLAIAAPAPSGPVDRRAPIIQPRGAEVISGKYIVKLKDGASEAALDSAIKKVHRAKPDHVYKASRFKGFAGSIEDDELQAIQDLPEVEYIEKESVYSINAYVSQTGAPWGLARLSSTGTSSTTYTRDNSDGAGTCSYVVDTGIYIAHSVSRIELQQRRGDGKTDVMNRTLAAVPLGLPTMPTTPTATATATAPMLPAPLAAPGSVLPRRPGSSPSRCSAPTALEPRKSPYRLPT